MTARPVVLVAAGLDPAGASGVLADLRALASRRVLGRAVITAQTVQRAGTPAVFVATDVSLLEQQLRAAAESPPAPRALKVGMAGTPAIVALLARFIADSGLPAIVDPVIAASRGGNLFQGSVSDLFPLLEAATLVTPNLAEAAIMTGASPITNEDGMVAAAQELLARGLRAVLIKGGHLDGEAADLLHTPEQSLWLRAPRSTGGSIRGTGCALASSIAAGLALGASLEEAVRAAKEDVAARIRRAHSEGVALLA
jgi:hydroxymethylpyrimidine/phosphomethylpyrimidine kinase